MTKSDFLNKMKAERKVELVEPSEEMRTSYLEKADECMKSAKVLFENSLFETSISMSYYTMYNSLIAMLFKCGIKCENHSASILLLKILFNQPELFKIISWAKKERIDKQYYVSIKGNSAPIRETAKSMLPKAEDFLVKIKLLINNLRNEEIETVRKKFEKRI